MIDTNIEVLVVHHPGSPKAREQGCKCPIMDNAHGRGIGGDGARYGWVMSSQCMLHAASVDEIMGAHYERSENLASK
jgi:hypothetical protein